MLAVEGIGSYHVDGRNQRAEASECECLGESNPKSSCKSTGSLEVQTAYRMDEVVAGVVVT